MGRMINTLEAAGSTPTKRKSESGLGLATPSGTGGGTEKRSKSGGNVGLAHWQAGQAAQNTMDEAKTALAMCGNEAVMTMR